jgi:hypothetical protein
MTASEAVSDSSPNAASAAYLGSEANKTAFPNTPLSSSTTPRSTRWMGPTAVMAKKHNVRTV